MHARGAARAAPRRGGSRASGVLDKIFACEKFWPRPFLRNHTHLIAAKRGNKQKTGRNQWSSIFISTDRFISQILLEIFWGARASYVYRSLAGGGCLSTQSTPPVAAPATRVCEYEHEYKRRRVRELGSYHPSLGTRMLQAIPYLTTLE